MTDPAPRELSDTRGPGRAIVITLIVLALVLVVADLGLRLWARTWVEDRIERSLNLPREPAVRVGGLLFLPQFVRGRFAEVEVEMEELSVEGLVMDRVVVELAGVEFSQGDLLAGRGGTLRVDRGRGRVEVTQESLNAFLSEREVPVTVRLVGPRVRASTSIEVLDQEITATARGPLRLEDGALVFDPERVRVDDAIDVPTDSLSFEFDLPVPLQGMRYERVQVRDGVVVVRASLDQAEVDLAGTPQA